MTSLHTQGPVPVWSWAYVERPFESEIYRSVIAGRWVLLLGPRQHGKTTALYRIKARFEEVRVPVAIVDLQSIPPQETYIALLSWVAAKVHRQFRSVELEGEPHSYPDEFSSWLELVLPEESGPVVVAIDEASSIVNDQWRNTFYGQIRSITTARATAGLGEVPERIRFIFSGTFRPETLIPS